MSNLLGNEVWQNIGKEMDGAVHVVAAIAYVGEVAPDLLILIDGDSIVVDGSDQSLRNGTVHPAALRAWVDDGVNVYSFAGLHAKMIVVEKESADESVLIVGSANASEASRSWRAEACLRTSDPESISEAGDLIRGWIAIAERVDQSWLTKADRVYQAPQPEPRRRKQTVALDCARLWIGTKELTDSRPSPETDAAISSIRDQFSDVVVSAWLMDQNDADLMRPGDSLILANARPGADPNGNSRTGPPAKVVDIVRAARGFPAAAIFAFDASWSHTTFARVKRALSGIDWSFDYPIEDAAAIQEVLSLFNLTVRPSEHEL